MWDAQGPSRWGWMQQGLNPDSLLFSPFSGLRSYPLRGSHSLDDLLDRPGNSTASSDYWDGQSRSRTPSHIPSRTPSPAPTPLPSSRRSSMGSMGVASDVKVSPLLQPALNPGVGQWAGRPGNPPCHPLAGWRGPSQPSRSLPICAGKDRMGFLRFCAHPSPLCPSPCHPASSGASPQAPHLSQDMGLDSDSPLSSRLFLHSSLAHLCKGYYAEN